MNEGDAIRPDVRPLSIQAGRSGPAARSAPGSTMAETVEGHGRDDDAAGDDLLDPVVEPELGAAIVDDGHFSELTAAILPSHST